jgi:hypothetical protein
MSTAARQRLVRDFLMPPLSCAAITGSSMSEDEARRALPPQDFVCVLIAIVSVLSSVRRIEPSVILGPVQRTRLEALRQPHQAHKLQ